MRKRFGQQALNLEAMSLPGCWPLKGVVQKAFEHYYAGDVLAYPPPGCLQEVSFFGKITPSMVGKFQRDNLDPLHMAFLMKLDQVKGDAEQLRRLKDNCNHVPVRFNLRRTDNERLLAAYQLKEHEEKNAELLGHSLLVRARELVGLQDHASNTNLLPPWSVVLGCCIICFTSNFECGWVLQVSLACFNTTAP